MFSCGNSRLVLCWLLIGNLKYGVYSIGILLICSMVLWVVLKFLLLFILICGVDSFYIGCDGL